jgi:hypothetical protein
MIVGLKMMFRKIVDSNKIGFLVSHPSNYHNLGASSSDEEDEVLMSLKAQRAFDPVLKSTICILQAYWS